MEMETEKRAYLFLKERRWPSREGEPWSKENAICPRCGSGPPEYVEIRQNGEEYFRCMGKKPRGISGKEEHRSPYVFTVRTGTILERSHTPLSKWLRYFVLFAERDDLTHTAAARILGVNRHTAARLSSLTWGLKNVREEEPDFFLKQIVLELLRTRKGRQAEPGRKRR